MESGTKHLLLLLALASAAPEASAQCANLRAENREAHWGDSGTGTRCRRYLSIFGVTIGLGSNLCPDVRFFYPPRRDCIVVPNSGTDCEKIGEIALQRWECACSTLIDVDLGIVEQSCDCSLMGDAGFFDDHATIPCATDV